MTESTPAIAPATFADLFAVVLPAEADGTCVRWNPDDRSWWCSNPYGAGFVKQDPSRRIGADELALTVPLYTPASGDIAAAAQLADGLMESGQCANCEAKGLRLHAITPDVFDEPTMLCLLRPSTEIVESFGGGGRLKHWGSPFGCHSVADYPIRRPNEYVDVGYYLYGEPLTTLEAVDRGWCSRCQGYASNLWHSIASPVDSELDRKPDRAEIRVALRQRERGRIQKDLLRHLRRALSRHDPHHGCRARTTRHACTSQRQRSAFTACPGSNVR